VASTTSPSALTQALHKTPTSQPQSATLTRSIWTQPSSPMARTGLSRRRSITAGHSSTATLNLTVDNTPPTAAILAPADGASLTGVATFTINIGDATALGSATLTLTNADGQSILVGATTTPGATSFELDTRRIQSGSYTLELDVTDRAGNQADPVTETVAIANPSILGSADYLSQTTGPAGLSVDNGSGDLTISADDVSTKGLGVAMLLSAQLQQPRHAGRELWRGLARIV